MKREGRLSIKLKNGHFWTGLISCAFILSAIIIFLIDYTNDAVSFSYIISSMLCVYVASLAIFIDIVSVRIRANRKNAIVCAIFAAVEIAVTVITVLTIGKYAVLQNELNALYAEWGAFESLSGSDIGVYDRYIELSKQMGEFYIRMGALFMLWWVSPFVVSLFKIKEKKTPAEEEE